MLRRQIRGLVVALAAWGTCCVAAGGGELAPELIEQLGSKSPVEIVKVWIKLPQLETADQLSTSVSSMAGTRQGRHLAAIQRLKNQAYGAQKELLQHLRHLESSGRAGAIKAHWIANLVEAEVAAGELNALAARDDVEIVYSEPQITLVRPDKADAAVPKAAGIEDNITFIRAPEAWDAGYTGIGRIICTFDTGVDGDHPALADSWNGLDGDSSASWFDPRDGELFPHPIDGSDHGTHVTGIALGHNDATGDTIGVAPDAKWISAAVIDIAGASIIDGFEWAADPDGDANTIADVPDVINHSWGVKNIDCLGLFYNIVRNLEAMDIVSVFAAGNDGMEGSQTIRNPANGAEDSLDCFAVGNVDILPFPPVRYTTSSRGPSDCNGAIKPNVCAPGRTIRSALPGTGYGDRTGTSMSAPHVAGLVALLRQKNPDASAEEVKAAIMTTARDFGYSLPNNDLGWGIIDCMAALDALAPAAAPSVRVYAFDHDPISPGDTVVGTVVLQNIGTLVTGISATLVGSDPSLTILAGSASFGTIESQDTVRSSDTIRVVVSDTITTGTVLSLDFEINSDVVYADTAKLYFLIEPATARLMVTHDANRIDFTISNFGTYGMGTNSFFPAGGVGFRFDAGNNDLWECGLMIGTGASHVSDGVRNMAVEPDGDFRVLPGGNIELSQPGFVAAQETQSLFSDERAEAPLGLEIIQQTWAFDTPPDDDFLIFRFIVRNTNPYSIGGILFGIYADWDIGNYSSNAGGYELTDDVLWMAYFNGSTYGSHRGITILHGNTASAFTGLSDEIIYFPEGYTETEKWTTLSDGFGTSDTYRSESDDLFHVMTAGPLNMAAGEIDTVAVAFLAGDTVTALVAAATQAQQVYNNVLMDCCVGIRGNVDNDPLQEINILDLTTIVRYLFTGGPEPVCRAEANINGDPLDEINILDITYLVRYLFGGGAAPPACR